MFPYTLIYFVMFYIMAYQSSICFRYDRFVRHMWQHTEYRPFSCNVCKKGFVQQKDVERHKAALHSGKRPTVKTCFCTFCETGDYFIHQDYLIMKRFVLQYLLLCCRIYIGVIFEAAYAYTL